MSDVPHTIDTPNELPKYSPICDKCIHLVNGFERRCRAFPDGIPDSIWRGTNDHTKAVDGDGGIRFQSRF